MSVVKREVMMAKKSLRGESRRVMGRVSAMRPVQAVFLGIGTMIPLRREVGMVPEVSMVVYAAAR